jgi:hypothetical protein
MAPRAHRPRPLLLVCCAVLLPLLGACGDDRTPTTTAEQAAASDHDHDDASAHDDDASLETDDPDSHDHLPATDPCSLVTKAQATTALGPVAGLSEDDPIALGVVSDQRVCAVSLERDPNVGANIGLTDHDAAGKFDRMGQRLGGFGTAVDGVGDRATWFENFRLLLTLRGDTLVTIQVRETDGNAKDLQDRAVGLARLALAGLPTGTGEK